MPRPKGARAQPPSSPKVAASPNTPVGTPVGTLAVLARPRVCFSPRDRVHQFSVLQSSLDERREHWHQILDAAALYNSDEDDAFDESDEDIVADALITEPAAAAQAAPAPTGAPPSANTVSANSSVTQRRSSREAGIDDAEQPRCAPARQRSCPPPAARRCARGDVPAEGASQRSRETPNATDGRFV